MSARYFPTSGHLLLCQHQNCRARGADLLMLALTRALEQEKLLYYKAGGSVRLTGSGCLGACGYGPVLACYRSVPASEMLSVRSRHPEMLSVRSRRPETREANPEARRSNRAGTRR
jgi:hypothetical protein